MLRLDLVRAAQGDEEAGAAAQVGVRVRLPSLPRSGGQGRQDAGGDEGRRESGPRGRDEAGRPRARRLSLLHPRRRALRPRVSSPRRAPKPRRPRGEAAGRAGRGGGDDPLADAAHDTQVLPPPLAPPSTLLPRHGRVRSRPRQRALSPRGEAPQYPPSRHGSRAAGVPLPPSSPPPPVQHVGHPAGSRRDVEDDGSPGRLGGSEQTVERARGVRRESVGAVSEIVSGGALERLD
mmetsp:Transcript_20767/g.69357  ORF Transcript_20767/g.69357 Transcript_20767/m.69357 type:complete len:235 (+) Transcript_20767:417-1121(+)